MKTVMKKMFCLLLVAVLMVGAMPFQAFADSFTVQIQVNGTPVATESLSGPIALAAYLPAGYAASDCTAVNASNDDPWSAVLSLGDTTNITNNTVLNYQITVCPCGIPASNTTSNHTNTACPQYVICNGAIGCPATANHFVGCGSQCNGTTNCPNGSVSGGVHQAGCLSQKVCDYCHEVGHVMSECSDLICSCGSSRHDKLHPASCTEIYDCCGGNEVAGTHASDCPNYFSCCGAAKTGNHATTCTKYYACCAALKTGSHAANCTQYYACCGASKTGNHAAGCSTQKCSVAGCTSYNGHPGTHTVACNITAGCIYNLGHTGSCNAPCTTSGCAKQYGHSGSHACKCDLPLERSNNHASTCSYFLSASNNYSLNVWAKMWVGETLSKTILLDTITGLSGNDVVPYVIGNNVSRLESKFPAGYNNIEWTKAVYYEIDSKTTGTVDTKMKVSEENNVFINLYSTEKLVVVRVHTGKTYAVDRSVQVGGFRVGETVTYNDVLKAVQKYYNVSTMKMYTYGEWEKVVNGKTGATTPNFVVQEGDNVYEVYLTGSAKTTTTTKKADSSNPKTGDTIFVPAMVLTTSVSALAVLFYLNKKRAY